MKPESKPWFTTREEYAAAIHTHCRDKQDQKGCPSGGLHWNTSAGLGKGACSEETITAESLGMELEGLRTNMYANHVASLGLILEAMESHQTVLEKSFTDICRICLSFCVKNKRRIEAGQEAGKTSLIVVNWRNRHIQNTFQSNII